jgi:hypothetical protein
MSDADIIGRRIMEGISKGLADLNQMVQIKNAAEEGERKRLEFERKEADENREINWRLHPTYMNAPKEIQDMFDKQIVDGGYSKNGQTLKNRDLKNVAQTMGNSKEMMTQVYEAGAREQTREIARLFQEKMDYASKPYSNKEEYEKNLKRYDDQIAARRAKEEELRGNLGKYLEEHQKTELTKQHMKAQMDEIYSKVNTLNPALAKQAEAHARYFDTARNIANKTSQADYAKDRDKKIVQRQLMSGLSNEVQLLNTNFLTQLQNGNLGEAERTKLWNQYIDEFNQKKRQYAKLASIDNLSETDIWPENLLTHKQFGIKPTGGVLPDVGAQSVSASTPRYSAPGTIPTDTGFDPITGLATGAEVGLPHVAIRTGPANKDALPVENDPYSSMY